MIVGSGLNPGMIGFTRPCANAIRMSAFGILVAADNLMNSLGSNTTTEASRMKIVDFISAVLVSLDPNATHRWYYPTFYQMSRTNLPKVWMLYIALKESGVNDVGPAPLTDKCLAQLTLGGMPGVAGCIAFKLKVDEPG